MWLVDWLVRYIERGTPTDFTWSKNESPPHMAAIVSKAFDAIKRSFESTIMTPGSGVVCIGDALQEAKQTLKKKHATASNSINVQASDLIIY